MEILPILAVAGVTFAVCFLADKLFRKLFRNKAQHHSGLSLRLNKKYGAFGLILFVLGLAAIFAGLSQGYVLIIGGALVMAAGIGLVVYYMTYGIFYDDEGFVYTSFGKKSATYRYNQIRCQQVYLFQGGNIMVELHMADGSAVQVQLQLEGAENFMNTAFLGWVRQKNLDIREGNWDFHDPSTSRWFPSTEEVN